MRVSLICGTALLAALLSGCGGSASPPAAKDPAKASEGQPTSKPTQEDGKKTLEEVFTSAGAPVKVVRFSRTQWRDFKFDAGPPTPTHGMCYEAEVEFQKDCQLKEQSTAHWSPRQNPDIEKDYEITVGDPVRFKKGEKKTIRGCLMYKWKDGSWRQDNTIEVEP
jgi:hypothetical protein